MWVFWVVALWYICLCLYILRGYIYFFGKRVCPHPHPPSPPFFVVGLHPPPFFGGWFAFPFFFFLNLFLVCLLLLYFFMLRTCWSLCRFDWLMQNQWKWNSHGPGLMSQSLKACNATECRDSASITCTSHVLYPVCSLSLSLGIQVNVRTLYLLLPIPYQSSCLRLTKGIQVNMRAVTRLSQVLPPFSLGVQVNMKTVTCQCQSCFHNNLSLRVLQVNVRTVTCWCCVSVYPLLSLPLNNWLQVDVRTVTLLMLRGCVLLSLSTGVQLAASQHEDSYLPVPVSTSTLLSMCKSTWGQLLASSNMIVTCPHYCSCGCASQQDGSHLPMPASTSTTVTCQF